MIKKYQKPYCRNLGEILPTSDGVCFRGSVANTGQPNPTNNCFQGNVASGAGCGYGQSPGTIACNAGGVPQYFGCDEGLFATSLCVGGQGVS